ncbi:MAG TPA: hypothetical protein VM012_09300 [Flavitalea sp.]|nr:hypothetical protein [Flavitalea sp.]
MKKNVRYIIKDALVKILGFMIFLAFAVAVGVITIFASFRLLFRKSVPIKKNIKVSVLNHAAIETAQMSAY